jgi:hypothetical protein
MKRSQALSAAIVAIIVSLIFIIIIFYYYNNEILRRHATGVDKFGIREIYPTKPDGEEWFMNSYKTQLVIQGLIHKLQ